MEFTLYDIEEPHRPRHLRDEDIVEEGLSPGEMRQSLLDRLREELQDGNVVTVNNCLADFDLFIVEKHLHKAKGMQQALEDVENVLYAADDEAFEDSIWVFTDEVIYVLGEEE